MMDCEYLLKEIERQAKSKLNIDFDYYSFQNNNKIKKEGNFIKNKLALTCINYLMNNKFKDQYYLKIILLVKSEIRRNYAKEQDFKRNIKNLNKKIALNKDKLCHLKIEALFILIDIATAQSYIYHIREEIFQLDRKIVLLFNGINNKYFEIKSDYINLKESDFENISATKNKELKELRDNLDRLIENLEDKKLEIYIEGQSNKEQKKKEKIKEKNEYENRIKKEKEKNDQLNSYKLAAKKKEEIEKDKLKELKKTNRQFIKQQHELNLKKLESEQEQQKIKLKIDSEQAKRDHEFRMMEAKTRQEELKYLREQAQLKGINNNIKNIKDFQKNS